LWGIGVGIKLETKGESVSEEEEGREEA